MCTVTATYDAVYGQLPCMHAGNKHLHASTCNARLACVHTESHAPYTSNSQATSVHTGPSSAEGFTARAEPSPVLCTALPFGEGEGFRCASH